MCFIGIKVVLSGSIEFLNYFKIIGLDLFFPKLTNDLYSFILGAIFATSIYIIFLMREIKLEKDQ